MYFEKMDTLEKLKIGSGLQQAPESHSSRWHGRIECQQATWENLRSTLILICWKNNWEHLFY